MDVLYLADQHLQRTRFQRCSVDDDEYPSFKKKPEERAPEEAAQDEAQNDPPEVDIVKEGTGAVNKAEPEMPLLASRPSFKWMTPTGARIGCLRDYPADLQSMALEQVNLSPRVVPSPSANRLPIPSPRPSPRIRLSPRLHYMGLPTPTGVRLPVPSPAPPPRQQQFAGFQTPAAVELTLPSKHKGK
jgi:hypothetical protein